VDPTFDVILAQLRSGDQGAAAQVFHRFTNRLIGLARIHLDSRIRQKVDPEDVLQSVYRSFFVRQARGEFDFEGWDGLWSLLAVFTVRKCARVCRHFQPGARDFNAEVPGGSAGENAERTWEAIDRGPTPTHAVMLAELVEQLMADLNERERAVASLALQGYTVAEIVEETGVPSSTAYRVLGEIKEWLQQRALS
jgi:RNA polymerase sigma-70 factor (ECF subfamily)